MFNRIITAFLLIFVPISASAAYFPDGIDWTHPSQSRFVQSLYLNMLGRAPSASETRERVNNLRRIDNRTARLRTFEALAESAEYQRAFRDTDKAWQIFQAPDYNYNNGVGYWRYTAAVSRPADFQRLTTKRFFSEGIAASLANYYNAFCYTGEPCLDNPELARGRGTGAVVQTTTTEIHACADPANVNSQFKWVAINGTTYPRGIGRNTICLEDSYFVAEELTLKHYQCDSGYENCRRNPDVDLIASRAGTDNSGYPSLFFRDGSRLALTNIEPAVESSDVLANTNSDSELLFDPNAHDCADSRKTTSRFTWIGPNRSAESKGIGASIICMDNFYYAVERLTLVRHQCRAGFLDCQPDTRNNLSAEKRTRVNGNPGLLFANGTTLSLTARDVVSTTRRESNVNAQVITPTDSRLQIHSGADCADPKKRMSQFRWKSDGLNSWPDGIDGRFICQNDSYYEIEPTRLRHYTCQSNYTGCRANPRKDIAVSQASNDGLSWTLNNGDQLMLISR